MIERLNDSLSKIRVPKLRVSYYLIPSLLIFILLMIIGINVEGSQQFSELSRSFLQGRTYFLTSIGGLGQDPIFYHGKVFWGEGLFPSILLAPFVAIFDLFNHLFYQGYIKWALVLGIVYFIYQLARKFLYTREDSINLVFGFILGSVFIGVASVSSSWLFAQVVTTFLILWSLYEFFYRRRWWLIGMICGLILLTRATASPIIIFYGLEVWQINKYKIKHLLQLGVPFAIGVIIVGVYNFIRFHNPFNGGYEYQLLSSDSAVSRSYGIFSLSHIPTNFVAAFMSGPVTVLRNSSSWILRPPYISNNINGMSLFFNSPFFLYFFTQKWKIFDKTTRNLIVSIILSCLLVLSFYGIGKDQFGFRYSMDYLPELFVLFMIIYKKNNVTLSRGMKFLLLGSGILNFYLLFSYI
jgi:hypothetical protein